MRAVSLYGLTLKYASLSLKSDIEVVLKAIETDAAAIKYASENFRDTNELALAAVEKNVEAYENVANKLKENREFVLKCVDIDKRIYYSMPSDELKSWITSIFRLRELYKDNTSRDDDVEVVRPC